MTSVYIIGGSGYTGGELVRILSKHGKVGEISVSSQTYKNKRFNELHPTLDEIDLTFEELDFAKANNCDFVFCCVPHQKAMGIVPKLKTKVVDLSADYRLKDAKVYEENYAKHTSPELLKKAVYGLPELYRDEIKDADLVANPGCLASGAILACYPMVKEFDVKEIVIDAKTGVSGAGKNPKGNMVWENVKENVVPYKVTGHRHIAEMEQELGHKVHFTPHVVSAFRGILTSVYAFIDDSKGLEEVYEKYYKKEEFVDVTSDVPSLLKVRGTNNCDIGGFARERDRVIVFSAIDNLVKGASGQAVQNMNLMAGFKENEALKDLGDVKVEWL